MYICSPIASPNFLGVTGGGCGQHCLDSGDLGQAGTTIPSVIVVLGFNIRAFVKGKKIKTELETLAGERTAREASCREKREGKLQS